MLLLPLMAFGGLGWMEVLIVLGIIVLLFGASRIPRLARSLGQGANEFKRGMKDGAREE